MGGGGTVQQSPGEKVQADLAEEQWNDYETKFQPLDDQRIARAKDKDRGRTLGINMAAGGAGQAYDGAEQTVINNMVSRGVNPNSGNFVNGVSSMKRSRGSSVGKASVGADVATDRRYAGRMLNTIAHGRGKQGIALEGIRGAAMREHNNAVNEANMKTAEYSSMMSGLGSLAGFGVGMASKNGMFDMGDGKNYPPGITGKEPIYDPSNGPR